MSEEIANPTRNRGSDNDNPIIDRNPIQVESDMIPIFTVYLCTREDRGVIHIELVSKLHMDKILEFINDNIRQQGIVDPNLALEKALLTFQVVYFSLLRLLRRTITALDNNFEITLSTILEDIRKRLDYKEEHTYIG